MPAAYRDRILSLALSFVLCAPLAAYGGEMPMQCRHLEVSANGEPIVGIEDMALDQRRDRLILSAYNRQQVDDDLAAGRPPKPGGLYLFDLAQLRTGASAPLKATQARVAMPGGTQLFPHGIGLRDVDGAQRLAVVNRRPGYPVDEATELLLLEDDGDGFRLLDRVGGTPYCRANDVTLVDKAVAFFTFDQQHCGGWRVWLERAVTPASSGVRKMMFGAGNDAPPATVIGDMAFANGIVIDALASTVFVAASRAGEVRGYDLAQLDKGATSPRLVAQVEGGPDNLSISADGTLVAAVHPSPFALFLHINSLTDLPASRVVSVDGAGAATLLAAGGGDQLPGAATAALMVDGRLVVSSAWDYGLGVCTPVDEDSGS